jgi:hypothetical protein
MDDRTLIPGMLPIVQLNGHSTIPSNLPLESIAARVVVPRDVKAEALNVVEDTSTPLQPSELDERITVPQGAAPPVTTLHLETVPTDLVESDIFLTGEVNLATPFPQAEPKWDVIVKVSSIVVHAAVILAIIFLPKIFPAHVPTAEEEEIARKEVSFFIPPGALESLKPTPRIVQPRPAPINVDPRILRTIAPPTPPPASKVPERVPENLPSAPIPKNVSALPTPAPDPAAKSDAPKPLALQPPDQPVPSSRLKLPPMSSPGSSIQNSMREAQKMSAPRAIGGGGQLPTGGSGSGGTGSAFGGLTMLTPDQGVDFNNYLARVYTSVKRNWFAVMTESVYLGDKGMVVLHFRIMRNGSVPVDDPARVRGSGKEPLDRAAVSSIRASNPFEPLPSAFSGDYIELQFAYYYNLQPENVP